MRQCRPFTPHDVTDVHALVRRCEAADSSPIVTPVEEILELFDDPNFDAGHDGFVVTEEDRIVAWAHVSHRPSTAVEERAFLIGYVDPSHRRAGIGSMLLELTLQRARALLASSALPAFVRASVYEWQTDAIALLASAGMEPVRYFEEMIRPLGDPPTAAPPANVDILTWRTSDDDHSLAVVNDAFLDHWGFAPRDALTWSAMLDSYGFRRDLSCVAVDGGELVGVSMNWHIPEDREVTGRLDGWIGTLGVRRPWRKSGVASALVARSLEAFERAGFTHALLGVDAENPSGATRLYRALGFETRSRGVTHQLAL